MRKKNKWFIFINIQLYYERAVVLLSRFFDLVRTLIGSIRLWLNLIVIQSRSVYWIQFNHARSRFNPWSCFQSGSNHPRLGLCLCLIESRTGPLDRNLSNILIDIKDINTANIARTASLFLVDNEVSENIQILKEQPTILSAARGYDVLNYSDSEVRKAGNQKREWIVIKSIYI